MSDAIEFDIVIVGAGPSGLAAAIRYTQLCKQANIKPKICVLEKGAQVGAHILSGAAFEPRALNELLPDWRNLGAPLETPITKDEFLLLTEHKTFSLPVPPLMKNKGNYIISLGLFCQWLARIAQDEGVEIYPGFAASSIIYDEKGNVCGVKSGDLGRDKEGKPKANFQGGMNIIAKHTLLAEGCRGSLSQEIIRRFALNKHSQPQTYGLGIKEIWELAPAKFKKGKVVHSIGWPLDNNTYGGTFLYHWGDNLLSIGLIVGLDYQNPYLNPYEEFQRFKHHPYVKNLLADGRCIGYGARALNEGGWQSIPELTFPGGMLIGDSAGFLNVAKIKGNHTAMKSGMIAAECIFNKENYNKKIKQSWVGKELYRARNIRPGFHSGLWWGLSYAAIDTYLFHGYAPWTFANHADNTCTKLAKLCQPITYPKPDGILSFDRMTSVSRTNIYQEENQPNHLIIKDKIIPVKVNWQQYAGLEARYCPAGVYEFIGEEKVHLQINAANCIHCKTCDIKDPKQNIQWTPPEGGGGPNYSNM